MKVLYSELKKWIPGLKASPDTVGHALTLIGLMTDSVEEVVVAGKKDVVFDLEVRQNRPDYLGVWGVARDLACYLNLPFKNDSKASLPSLSAPKVKVSAKKDVKRVTVFRVEGLDNSTPSPKWLAQSLVAKGLNSVSLLVDISNWAMLTTGYPNHFFDADEVDGNLEWTHSSTNQNFITLDGTQLKLSKDKELIVRDSHGALVLASAVGGKRASVGSKTKNIIFEVAAYDPVKMRMDARGLGVYTDASVRLEKSLSPFGVMDAALYTASLLREFFPKAKISKSFDFYPKKHIAKKIVFSTLKCSKMGGVDIKQSEAAGILQRLGCQVQKKGNDQLVVIPHVMREDLEGEADLFEEVLRMKGFDKIPLNRPVFKYVEDVTPKRLLLEERLRDVLNSHGFDEILSSPLTTSGDNSLFSAQEKEVRLQNAINEELPVLRVSLVPGLVHQLCEHVLGGVEHVAIFEIGKVFEKASSRIAESEKIAVLLQGEGKEESIVRLQVLLKLILGQMGITNLIFDKSDKVASGVVGCLKVESSGVLLGELFKLKPVALSGNKKSVNVSAFELNIDNVVQAISKSKPNGASELQRKIVSLDTNVELPKSKVLTLQEKLKRIKGSNVWSVEVVDEYGAGEGMMRFTIRVSYAGLDDVSAKDLHERLIKELA